MTPRKHDRKHLTNSQRLFIEKGLNDGDSFSEIGRKTGKDPSTISKEIRRHLTYHTKKEFGRDIPCTNRNQCRVRSLCGDINCMKLFKQCTKPSFHCTQQCSDYKPKVCADLKKPPYVCNGCNKRQNCLMEKVLYFAKHANDCYLDLLVSSREGINQSPADIAMLDDLISPLLKKGQSMAHIYANHGSRIPCSRRTLYNYIDKAVFSARNIDMRRRVRYKVRKKPTRVSLSAREFRVGRTYDDFKKLLKASPDTPVVEMDTVEGGKGKGSKVFLTMLFRNCSLMLIFLMEDKTADSVAKVFDWMSSTLGTETFKEIFPMILTD